MHTTGEKPVMVRMRSKGQISEVMEAISTSPRDLIVVVGMETKRKWKSSSEAPG